MSKTVLLGLILVSNVAWAETYLLKFDMRMKDQKGITGSSIVDEGKEGRWAFGNKVIRFTPVPQGKDAVKISTVIEEDSKVVARPSVIVLLNHAAEIAQSDSAGNKTFSLKWTPSLVRGK